MGGVVLGVSILILAVVLLLLGALSVAVKHLPPPGTGRFTPAAYDDYRGHPHNIVPVGGRPRGKPKPARSDDHVRLLSRVLFARRSFDSITLDCTLLRVEHGATDEIDPPAGLPFTLRLRCPDTSWFAARVEELLNEWAEENEELVLELSQEDGKVRTMISCRESSVHLELAGAAGLDAKLTT